MFSVWNFEFSQEWDSVQNSCQSMNFSKIFSRDFILIVSKPNFKIIELKFTENGAQFNFNFKKIFFTVNKTIFQAQYDSLKNFILELNNLRNIENNKVMPGLGQYFYKKSKMKVYVDIFFIQNGMIYPTEWDFVEFGSINLVYKIEPNQILALARFKKLAVFKIYANNLISPKLHLGLKILSFDEQRNFILFRNEFNLEIKISLFIYFKNFAISFNSIGNILLYFSFFKKYFPEPKSQLDISNINILKIKLQNISIEFVLIQNMFLFNCETFFITKSELFKTIEAETVNFSVVLSKKLSFDYYKIGKKISSKLKLHFFKDDFSELSGDIIFDVLEESIDSVIFLPVDCIKIITLMYRHRKMNPISTGYESLIKEKFNKILKINTKMNIFVKKLPIKIQMYDSLSSKLYTLEISITQLLLNFDFKSNRRALIIKGQVLILI